MMLPRARTAAVLLAAALAAPFGACLAQGRDAASGDDALRAADATAAAMPVDANESRSAFGKVMGLMIGALQRQSHERAHPVRRVRTTAAGTPMGIEVGAAFRDAGAGRSANDVSGSGVPAHATAANATGTGGVAAARVPRAAPPEDPGLRQAVVAGSAWIATSPQ